MLAHGVHQRLRRPQEHSAVPVVVAGGQKFVGALLIWLFGKATDTIQAITQLLASLDISVSRFGTVRSDAHHDDVLASGGQLDAISQDLVEVPFILDYVISREHADHGI